MGEVVELFTAQQRAVVAWRSLAATCADIVDATTKVTPTFSNEGETTEIEGKSRQRRRRT